MIVSEFHIFNASILIVDDQEVNVALLEQMLQKAGYTAVTSTMNPHEVCALHRKNRYDLILLDLQMPGMDGFQVIEGLKTNAVDGYLPVMVITAQPGHKLRALQAGAKDFVSKPFDIIEVKTRIRNMLEVICCTKNSRVTTNCSNRPCWNAPPSCVKAKRVIAVSPNWSPTGTGSRTRTGISRRCQGRFWKCWEFA